MLYIDPVSGSIAVQAFLAGIVGGVTFFHRSIGRLLRRLFRRSDPHDPADQ